MKILVVSPDFPPLGTPQAYQSFRLVKALARAGHHITVVSAAPGGRAADFQHQDESRDISGVKQIIYKPPRYLRGSLGKAYRFMFPWDTRGHYFALRAVVRKVLLSSNFGGVITIAEPIVAHKVVPIRSGAKNERFRCCWYSDPVPLSADTHLMKFKWRREACERLARQTLSADCLVGVTEEIVGPVRALSAAGPAETFVLPHSFDPDDWPSRSDAVQLAGCPEGPLRIVHSGALYWDRHPFTLIEGARIFCLGNSARAVEIILQGNVAKAIQGEVRRLSGQPTVKLDGSVPFSVSKETIKHADILVIIDVDLAHNVHLPSKIADYVAARKPILYIGRPTAPTVRAVVGLHPAFRQAHSAAEIAHALAELTKIGAALEPARYNSVYNAFTLDRVYAPLLEKIDFYERNS